MIMSSNTITAIKKYGLKQTHKLTSLFSLIVLNLIKIRKKKTINTSDLYFHNS